MTSCLEQYEFIAAKVAALGNQNDQVPSLLV
uniref:Uncharacterized protein n=1 Tax=Physcomitrium patens TaxID=3218 RepID=A0A2K1JPN7_PHYPA|nr:hypothetical protein PHYPA_015885 [Physcomitrium patens]